MVLCFILIKNKWFVLLFIWGLSHGSNRSNINWFVHIHVICWIIEINGCFYNVTKSISFHYQAWYPWGSLQLCFRFHRVFVKGRSSVCRVSLGTRWTLDKHLMKLALNVFSIKSQSTASAQLSAYAHWLQTHTLDLGLFLFIWLKVDPHTKNQGRRSNGSNRRALTNTWTDGRNKVHYLAASLKLRGR